MEEKQLKTGTTTVGIKYKDGIVLAADKRATAGTFIASREAEKIIPITDKMAVTTAGMVSDIQILIKALKAELKLKELKTGRILNTKEAANLLTGFVYYNIRKMSMIPGISHFLLAGYDKTGDHLFEIYPDGSINEIKKFVSTGSGSPMAYGFLESEYKKGFSEEKAKEIVLKSMNSALKRDCASGDGIDLVIVNKNGVKKVLTKEKAE